MKRISFFLVTVALCSAASLEAQDAATEERMNKLAGKLEDVTAQQETLMKQISELRREIESVREVASKPTGNWASQDDLNRLKKAIEEVDRKRISDAEKVTTELQHLRKVMLESPVPTPKKPATSAPKDPPPVTDKTTGDEKGIEYVVQAGDSLSAIVAACKEKKIKVTMDQILKANPGLKPDKLKKGQKIFIPALPQS